MDAEERKVRAMTVKDAIETYEKASENGEIQSWMIYCWLHNTISQKTELLFVRDGTAVLSAFGAIAIKANYLQVDVGEGGFISFKGRNINFDPTFTTMEYPVVPTEGNDWVEFELLRWVDGLKTERKPLLDWYSEYCQKQDEEEVTESEN